MASYTRTSPGSFFVGGSFLAATTGRGRIANDALEGYVVYVGEDAMPDFTAAPAEFSATRPIDVTVTPPGAGTLDLWVVLRARSKYGLESPNQHPQIITIDTAGDEELGPLTTPTDAAIVTADDDYFIVSATYLGHDSDANPADTWNIYFAATTPPTPGVDAPVATGSVGTAKMAARIGPYATGGLTYHLAVTVERSADSEESAADTDSIVLGADPLTPTAVPGRAVAD